MAPKIQRVSEAELVEAAARLADTRARGVRIGIGDDAAVVRGFAGTVLTTDTQREGVHFRRAWLKPAEIGVRAVRTAVSDIAAMAARPRYVLLSLGLPRATARATAVALLRGAAREAVTAGAALVGGNLSRDDALSLVTTVIGEARGVVARRSGAHAGDEIWVTGPLGGAAAAIELFEKQACPPALARAYRRPPLRVVVAEALARRARVRTMIDVSDGLVRDLGHLCRASRLDAVVDPAAVPVARSLERASRAGRLAHPASWYALFGGDDYELLFAARPGAVTKFVVGMCEREGAMLRRIGMFVASSRRPAVHDTRGRRLEGAAFTHFGERT